MSDYKPVKGDRVRVVLEGEVDEVDGPTFTIGRSNLWSNVIKPSAKHVVSVEKVEPPVEVFKPGDVVRSGHSYYALFDEGYVDLNSGTTYRDGRAFCEKAFRSPYYEKVNLG